MIKEWKLPPELGGHPVKTTSPAPGMPGWYRVRIPGMCFDIMVQGECLVVSAPPEPAIRSLVVCLKNPGYPSYFQRLDEGAEADPKPWIGMKGAHQSGRSWAQLHQEFDAVVVLVDAGAPGLEDEPFGEVSTFNTAFGIGRDDDGDLLLTVGCVDAIVSDIDSRKMACAMLSDWLNRST